MSLDTKSTEAITYSADGRWRWDGQRWTPAGMASDPGIDVSTPVMPRAPEGDLAGLALSLGIGAITLAIAVFVFTLISAVNLVDKTVVAVLLVVGFLAGQLAVVLGLRPASRPRSGGLIAALTCGLVGMGLMLLWVVNVVLHY